MYQNLIVVNTSYFIEISINTMFKHDEIMILKFIQPRSNIFSLFNFSKVLNVLIELLSNCREKRVQNSAFWVKSPRLGSTQNRVALSKLDLFRSTNLGYEKISWKSVRVKKYTGLELSNFIFRNYLTFLVSEK